MAQTPRPRWPPRAARARATAAKTSFRGAANVFPAWRGGVCGTSGNGHRMRTALIANRSHAAFDSIAAAVDAAGTFYGPPEVGPGDRVVVLLGYDDVGSADARLAATALPSGAEVLLVRPDYGPRTPYAESCARAAQKLG